MTWLRPLGGRRVLAVAFVVAVACAAPDVTFVPNDPCLIACGGACEPCRDGQPCTVSMDCESKVCGVDGSCQSPSCSDGARNGDELGVDCGGAFCHEGCGIGVGCTMATDCQSGLCDASTRVCALNCRRDTDECDGDLDDPCETNLLTSSDSCGACGHACDLPHSSSSCAGGACRIDECSEPWLRCNTDLDDGCEVNGSTDVMNCGGCGTACPDFHGTPKCVDAECVIECSGAFGDCDHDPRTGCEASLDDVANCGACGNECPDANGVANCVGGECGVADCAEGFGDCDGDDVCESLQADPMNCGRCGNDCDASNGRAECVAGQCVVESCEEGWDDCDSGAADGGYSTGCETNVLVNPMHCGACDARCDVVANGTGTCAEGTCVLQCAAGFDDCDDDVTTGCETDTRTALDCGACDKACPGATPNCVEDGGSYQCQATITLPGMSPYTTATAAAGSLSFNVTPRAGTNRLLLVAIVSDALTNNAVSAGIAGARPGFVRLGNQAMTAGPSQVGVNDGWSPDLFVYSLALGDATSDGAEVALSIGGSSGPANVVVAQSLQLNGVRQDQPITGSAGGFLGAPDPVDPGVAAPALPIEVPGSVIYSFLSDYWDTRTCAAGMRSGGCPAWSVTPDTNLTLTETMATAPFNFYPPNSGNAPIRAFGMVVTSSSPSVPAPGSYAPTWSDPNPGRLTHLAVAIAPAQTAP